jgi:hypothetical protein
VNSFKSFLTVAILGAVGVGLYMKINSMPDPKPPKDFTSSWVEPPAIEMSADLTASFGQVPGVPSASSTAPGGMAPSYKPAPPGGTAPVYVPPSSGGSAPPIASHGHDSMPVSANVELPGSNDLGPSNTSPPSTDPFSTRITGGPSGGNDFAAGNSSADLGPAQNQFNSQVPANHGSPGASPDLGAQVSTGNSESLFYKTEHATFDAAWSEARTMLSQRNLAGAQLLLSAWYNNPTLLPAEKDALLDLLSGLAGTVIYSPDHHLEAPYSPAPGETLDQIARRYQISPELLAKINGLSMTQPLSPAQSLKVLRGPFGAQIDPVRHEMVLVLGGRYAGRFEVGLGRERQDIEGRYEVRRKMANPPYYGPDRMIEPGDAANPLGSHYLSLIKPLENEAATPFGIHGTNLRGDLQSDEARGYVRLSERDITDCYDILSEKSPVLIRR